MTRPRLTAAAVLVLTVLLTVFLVRVAYAQWLVFTPEYPGAPSPQEAERAVDRARQLSPRDATLRYWHAIELSRRMRAAWLTREFPSAAAAAATAADEAIASRPADPYTHLLAGVVAVETARHPRTEEAREQELWALAASHYRAALDSWPISRPFAQRVAEELVIQWPRAGSELRAVAVDAVRQVAETGGDGRLLEALFEATRDAGDSIEDSLALLAEATPSNAPNSLHTLGELLARFESSVADRNERASIRQRSLEAAAQAAIAANFDPGLLGAWLERWRTWEPERNAQRVRRLQDLTTAYPLSPGVWLARADVERVAGAPLDAATSAFRGTDLAINELARAIRQEAFSEPIVEAADPEAIEYLLRLAHVDTSGWSLFFRQRLRAPREVVAAAAGMLRELESHLSPLQSAATLLLEALASPGAHEPLVVAGRRLLAAGQPGLAATAFEIALERNAGAAEARQGLDRARQSLRTSTSDQEG